MRLSREAQIGIIFVVAAVILFFGFNYLKGHSVFQRYNTYYAVFDNADNLSTSDKVLYRGYKVGQVQALSFNPSTGQVLVEFEVLRAIPLPIDSRATITNLDLLGTKGLAIVPGKAEKLAQDGDTLLDSLATGTIDRITRELSPLKEKLEGLLSQLQQTASYLNAILEKEKGSIPRTLHSIEALADHTRSELTPTTAQLRRTLSELDQTLRELRPTLNNSLYSLEKTSDSLRARLPSLIAHLDSSSAQLNQALHHINEGKGSLGLLLRDSSLYRDLDKTTISLRMLLEELRIHPERFVHFSLFGRKRDSRD
ncbi:MAG: MlaD family protein [Bacteroidia bacterium]|nr:MlaD family protein [Bacteroidia bacterium]MDW8235696.1 MlaD family protein [Bacteroidia bacterium]